MGSTVGALLLSGLILLAVAGRKPEPLPVFGSVPEFSLTDSTGSRFGSEQLQGKICITDFIFTRRDGLCPLLTEEMARLQKTFASDSTVQLVSVSVDPEYDMPSVLAEFARHNNVNTRSWHLLTGKRELIRKFMVDGCRIGMPEDPLLHSDRLVLWDAQLQIRGYYPLSDPESGTNLTRDVTRLLRENRIPRNSPTPKSTPSHARISSHE